METLQYNTTRKQLIIPEYGRHIHKMIELVKEETNIDERNKKAKAIIGVMGNLNPHLRDVPDFQHKLWDQFLSWQILILKLIVLLINPRRSSLT